MPADSGGVSAPIRLLPWKLNRSPSPPTRKSKSKELASGSGIIDLRKSKSRDVSPNLLIQCWGCGADAELLTSLLALPPTVIAKHIWPHLGPWSRAQLRATCRELRALADDMLPETITCVMDPKDLPAPAAATTTSVPAAAAAAAKDVQQASAAIANPDAVSVQLQPKRRALFGGSARDSSPTAIAPASRRTSTEAAHRGCLPCFPRMRACSRGCATSPPRGASAAPSRRSTAQPDAADSDSAQALGAVAGLLARSTYVKGVDLVVSGSLPRNSGGADGEGIADAAASVSAAIMKLGCVSYQRLTRLHLHCRLHHCFNSVSCTPGVLRAIGTACPKLRVLSLHWSLPAGSEREAWEGAVRTLPATLEEVEWDARGSASGAALTQLLGAATQLKSLRSLKLTASEEMDAAPLAALAAHGLTCLQLDSFKSETANLSAVLGACGASLKSLALNMPRSTTLPLVLDSARHVTHLTVFAGRPGADWRGALDSLAAHTAITSLCLRDVNLLEHLCRDLEPQPERARDAFAPRHDLAHLRRLKFGAYFVAADDLDRLLSSQVLHPQCEVVLRGSLNVQGLAPEVGRRLGAALARTRCGTLFGGDAVTPGTLRVAVFNSDVQHGEEVEAVQALCALLPALRGVSPDAALAREFALALEQLRLRGEVHWLLRALGNTEVLVLSLAVPEHVRLMEALALHLNIYGWRAMGHLPRMRELQLLDAHKLSTLPETLPTLHRFLSSPAADTFASITMHAANEQPGMRATLDALRQSLARPDVLTLRCG
mmetsp:Transcript_18145/g.45734  ORF Transcript_18145/g.45734 Transcript_18145/m.45734 type:complete len:775 (-) Transcript_18145:1922-4246(-)